MTALTAFVVVASIIAPAGWLAWRDRHRPTWQESRDALGRACERGRG